MNDLIERIEAASGPDRELDAEIACAASRYDDSRIVYAKGKRWYRSPGKGRIPFHVGGGKGGTSFGIIYQQPRYTASIDAALTLVPLDRQWSITNCRSPKTVAQVGAFNVGSAATPALALCAAALKSRAYLKETNNGQ